MGAKKRRRALASEEIFRARSAPKIPFAFALDELDAVGPHTAQMFGCTAVYVGEKIVLILRDKPTHADDNGVWMATTKDCHPALRVDFPNMRSIRALGEATGWQLLPVDADDFEESVVRACGLIVSEDPRIGKVPKRRKRRTTPARTRGPVSPKTHGRHTVRRS